MQEKTIYALGFFDGVHLGHQALLNTCKALAAEYDCAAGVQTFGNHPDALVEGKAPGLINSIADREALLREMGMERVIVLPFDNALMHTPWQDYFQRLLTEFHAGGIVCGYDFRFGDRGAGNGEKLLSACKEAGIPCRVVPEQKVEGLTVSSTRIRGFLADGNIAEANRFLGHPHRLTGKVVAGHQLGRQTKPVFSKKSPPERLFHERNHLALPADNQCHCFPAYASGQVQGQKKSLAHPGGDPHDLRRPGRQHRRAARHVRCPA